jgi:septal ring factor EnvC (AmiA/AmiB activator)
MHSAAVDRRSLSRQVTNLEERIAQLERLLFERELELARMNDRLDRLEEMLVILQRERRSAGNE